MPNSVQIPLQDYLLLLTLLYRIRINNMFEPFDSNNNDEDNITCLIEVEILEEVQELQLYNRIKQLTSRFKENTRDIGERDTDERDIGKGPSQALRKEGININEDNIQLLVTKRARIWPIREPRRGIQGAQPTGTQEERTPDHISQSTKLYTRNRYHRTRLQVRSQLGASKGPNNRSQEPGAKKGYNNNKGIYRQELPI